MGRQSGDATTKATSSIALLQERFRQLQKVKERREEKELLRLLSESERVSPNRAHFDPSNLPFQSTTNMAFPFPHSNNRPTSASHDQSLSLGLDLHSKQPDTQRLASSQSLWHNAAASASSSKSFDYSDIDTSLHL